MIGPMLRGSPPGDSPAGDSPRGRGSAALAGSAVLHAALALAVVGLAHGPADRPIGPGAAPAPSVRAFHLPPAAAPAQPRREAPAPRRPAAPAPRPVPDHDERAGAPAPSDLPASAPERVPEPIAVAAEPVAVAAEPAPVVSEAELMRSEAQRIFGRRSRTGSSRGGPAAAAGLELALPEAADECGPPPRRAAGAAVELATVSGTVYREGTRIPLPGAHLQMVGTPYVAFSGPDGTYDLRFDPSLVDRCRTQYVRVTAPGFRAQTLVLYLGPSSGNAIPMRRR